MFMEVGWGSAVVLVHIALGAAALLIGRLISRGLTSRSQLGSPPPHAFADAAAGATANGRAAAAQKMLVLGPPPRARELVASVASGDATAEGVVQAMLERARVAHEMTHCIVPCKPLNADGSARADDSGNPLGVEALARAQELDTYDKRRRGPLHGLPFSLKECFQLQGTDATAGLGKFKSQDGVVDRTPARNSPLVDALLDAGAVPIAKTNVPQLMCLLRSMISLFILPLTRETCDEETHFALHYRDLCI